MDAVSLERFMQLRASAVDRMQQAQPASPAKASASSKPATDWMSILEGKRKEMGIAPSSAASAFSAPAAQATLASRYSSQATTGDVKSRSEQLQAQAAMGLPVRRVGNFIDLRA